MLFLLVSDLLMVSLLLATVVEVPVPKNVLERIQSIRSKLAIMMLRVSEIIVKRAHPFGEISTFVNAYTYSNSNLRFVVEESHDIHTLMGNIGRRCSLTDVGLVESVVEEFNLRNAVHYIVEYKDELSMFCRCLSHDLHLEERLAAVESEIVTYLFDWNPYDEYMLNDITDILSKVSAGKLIRIKYVH